MRDSAQLTLGKLTRRTWEDHTPCGSSTEEQRSQTAFGAKTHGAAGLLSVGGVGLVVTARCGDAPTAPPCPQPKSLAAARLAIFKQALSRTNAVEELREKRGGAKGAEKRRVKRVIANAPFGERILKSNSPRLSAFSASLRLFRPNSTA